jgi:hypothetical protein
MSAAKVKKTMYGKPARARRNNINSHRVQI